MPYLKNAQNHKKICKFRKGSVKRRIILLLAGAAIGLINGLFGGGGGMICVPILEKVLKINNKSSHATAIAVIFPLSLISAAIYVVKGYVSSLPLIFVTIGVVAGGVLGALILKILPGKIVRIIFALIMLAGGIKLFL